MLLYGNITAESCLFVEHEPENYSSEINKYQMELITAVHEAKTVLIEDIAFANGDKKIVTEALKDFAKTVKKYWDRFWAWVNNVFDRWIKHINDLFEKPNVAELMSRCSDLFDDANKVSILSSFVYRAPAVNMHRNLITILQRGFNPAVMKYAEVFDDFKHWDTMRMADETEGSKSFIVNTLDKITKTLENDAKLIDNEKPVREVKLEDIRVLISVFNNIPLLLKEYQDSLGKFEARVRISKDWGKFNSTEKEFPEYLEFMQAFSFAIQKHLEKINAETERTINDYGKLLSSWYPAAVKRIYEEQYS